MTKTLPKYPGSYQYEDHKPWLIDKLGWPIIIYMVILHIGLLVCFINYQDAKYVVNHKQARNISYGIALKQCIRSDAQQCAKLAVLDETFTEEDIICRNCIRTWSFTWKADSFTTTITLDRFGEPTEE